jgi:hypothetical protein
MSVRAECPRRGIGGRVGNLRHDSQLLQELMLLQDLLLLVHVNVPHGGTEALHQSSLHQRILHSRLLRYLGHRGSLYLVLPQL